jgi:hypothetical protein
MCGCLIDGHRDLLETLDWKTSNVLSSKTSSGETKCENARGTQLGYFQPRITPPRTRVAMKRIGYSQSIAADHGRLLRVLGRR